MSEFTWESLGLKLVENGYNITPLKFRLKIPCLPKWQKTRADPAQVRAWCENLNTNGNGPGWGLVLGENQAVVDIDISDKKAAEALTDLLCTEETLKPLVRIGQPPKLALVYRVDAPIRKQFSDQYKDEDGNLQRIEILGEGQQLVAYNIHPDTGKPYKWLGSSPRDTQLKGLPVLTQETIDAFLIEANKILRLVADKCGWTVVKQKKRSKASTVNGTSTMPSTTRLPGQLSTKELREVLNHPAIAPMACADHDTWVSVGMALQYDAAAQEKAYKLWDTWSKHFGGDKYGGPDETRAKWDSFGEANKAKPFTMASLYQRVQAHDQTKQHLQITDFYAYAPTHRFMHVPTREMWPATSVDGRLTGPLDAKGKPTRASAWLDQNRSVEQITWAPGLGEVIEDKVIQDGGWIDEPGNKCFNLYQPPIIEHGDPDKAGPWVDHVRTVYPDEADHLLDWFAHRVQHPQIKINHGLVLGGEPGIGKDTLLEPVKHAVGPWNFKECSPSTVMRRFNSFLRAVILRVNEARDLGDVDRYAFYDHMKNFMAAPPDALEIDEKNIREHYIPNLVGIIITTNYKGTGLFLPPDDRRHFVAWSPLPENPFDEYYWNSLWGWYENGGYEHVAAYLANRDVSLFNPKARPPQTPAFLYMVDANRSPEDAELADLLDQMKNPDAVTLAMIREHGELNSSPDFGAWLNDRRNRRQIPHRMEEAGYEVFRNPGAKDGLWKIGGKRQSVYINKASNFTVSQVNKRITAMVENAKPKKSGR